MRRSLTSLLAPCAAPLLLGACDLGDNLNGLGGTLLDPEAAVLDVPGRQLAQGTYTDLELDGSLESGGWVLARRTDGADSALSVISFADEQRCELPQVSEYQRVSSRIDVSLPGLLAYRRQGDDAPVEFAGFDCAPKLSPLAHSPLPSVPFPRSNPRGLLTLTQEGDLVLVDAREEQTVTVATKVTSGRTEGDRLWTLEGGQLVAYDANLQELTRVGTQVSELLILGGQQEPVAVIVDALGLRALNADLKTLELLDEDGCAPVQLVGAIGYFAPCADRTLTIHHTAPNSGKVHRLAPHVVLPQQALLYPGSSEGFYLYLTADDPEALSGDLHLARIEGDAVHDEVIATGATLSGQQVFLDWDGVSGTLALPDYELDDHEPVYRGLSSIAEKVAQLPGGLVGSARGVLTGYDGAVGTLRRFTQADDGSWSSTLLAEGVPLQTQTVDAESGDFAFVGDWDGARGTAYLVRDGVVEAVAESALKDTLRFLEQPHSLAYLADEGAPATATLRAWLFEAEQDLLIAQGVSEFRELPWPSPGLLYSVPQRDDDDTRGGIWFAKAR